MKSLFTIFFNMFFNFHTGALLLRLTLGVVLIAHSFYLKVFIFTLAGTASYFTSIGLPGFLAYVVCAIETLAGIAIILGVYSRFFALIVIPILMGATWAHWGSGWLFTNTGGGWEYPLVLVFIAWVQASIGDGRYVLSPRYSPSPALG